MRYFYEAKNDIEINERHNLNFPPHLHDFFEIGYIQDGSVTLTVEETEYSLESGNFLSFSPTKFIITKTPKSYLRKC